MGSTVPIACLAVVALAGSAGSLAGQSTTSARVAASLVQELTGPAYLDQLLHDKRYDEAYASLNGASDGAVQVKDQRCRQQPGCSVAPSGRHRVE
jgi:hypothetical protein